MRATLSPPGPAGGRYRKRTGRDGTTLVSSALDDAAPVAREPRERILRKSPMRKQAI
jgi:hypothetical protein